MPELSPGALSFFATPSAADLDDHRHRYRCPLNDDDDDNNNKDFAASSATTVTFPVIGASATSSTTAADRSAFFVCRHRRRLNDASSATTDRRNDSAKEPTDDGRPAVFRETLRGSAHGARLPVHILLHALPEFTDRQLADATGTQNSSNATVWHVPPLPIHTANGSQTVSPRIRRWPS
ncbi:hypothetical protein QTP88_011862 [Uroleucon formosanum]